MGCGGLDRQGIGVVGKVSSLSPQHFTQPQSPAPGKNLLICLAGSSAPSQQGVGSISAPTSHSEWAETGLPML